MARLNQPVTEARIFKVCIKGQTSHKEPNHHTRQLTLSKTTDLFKVLIKSPRELSEWGGSNMAIIDKYVQQSFSGAADLENLSKLFRLAAHKAVQKVLLAQEGQYFRVAMGTEVGQKRHSSLSSSTPGPLGNSDDGDSGHLLKDYEDDPPNRIPSSPLWRKGTSWSTGQKSSTSRKSTTSISLQNIGHDGQE